MFTKETARQAIKQRWENEIRLACVILPDNGEILAKCTVKDKDYTAYGKTHTEALEAVFKKITLPSKLANE